ncbi:response regulator transcription factor [Desulfotomaculum sp. 1211_IL3151]|uniref:response regulator transcription factor n=1 Tax=Desulfotomaculum sp. 1211_IL3151 TaxID=3084055 RepID=UPI002FDB9208
MPKVLVVDDEQPIRELIKYNLEREDYQVLQAGDGDTALEMARAEMPDIILLDVMLPGQDGLSVCRTLNQQANTRAIPIIMLSAKGEELDKVLGLEMGADDYITKPFSPRELLARIKARLRRQTVDHQLSDETGRIIIDKLVIDQERFIVAYKGIKQDFTPKEFELLRYLARNPGKVFTRDFLLEQIWGYDFSGDSRTVDVHIRHIRQKLEQIPEAPQFIETVRGVGYRFKEV